MAGNVTDSFSGQRTLERLGLRRGSPILQGKPSRALLAVALRRQNQLSEARRSRARGRSSVGSNHARPTSGVAPEWFRGLRSTPRALAARSSGFGADPLCCFGCSVAAPATATLTSSTRTAVRSASRSNERTLHSGRDRASITPRRGPRLVPFQTVRAHDRRNRVVERAGGLTAACRPRRHLRVTTTTNWPTVYAALRKPHRRAPRPQKSPYPPVDSWPQFTSENACSRQ